MDNSEENMHVDTGLKGLALLYLGGMLVHHSVSPNSLLPVHLMRGRQRGVKLTCLKKMAQHDEPPTILSPDP